MAVDNLAIANATSYAIRSLHDFNFKPSVMEQLYRSYGNGFNALDILRSLNYWYPISNEVMTAQEESRDVRTITMDAASTVGATPGATASIVLDADDLDANYNFYPRVGFTITLGSTLTAAGLVQAQITSIAGQGTDTITLTVTPVDDSVTLSSTYIGTGKEVAIGDSAFAAETGQPEPTSVGYAEREFYAQIFKETIQFGGMELAKQKWVEVEGIGFFNKELARAEFALDRQMEFSLLMGQPVSMTDNVPDITQTSLVDGNEVPVWRNKGIYTWINELGGEIEYSASGGIVIADLDEAAEYFEQQGITSDVVLVLCGGSYMRRIENSGIEFVGNPAGETGGGGSLPSEFIDKIDTSGGEPGITLDLGFRAVKKGGILFLFKKLPLLSDPKGFGISSYYLNDLGIMFPVSKVKDRKSGLTIPNLSARYVANGAYSRKRVMGTISGMDGFAQQRFGYPIINEIDGTSTYWLSHVMFPFLEAYKGILHQVTTT